MSEPWFTRNRGALDELKQALKVRHPTLHVFLDNGAAIVKGTYAVDGIGTDRYSLEIILPHDYPHSLPHVREVAGRIPRIQDRHVNPEGTLCLGVPEQLWMELKGDCSVTAVLDGPIRNFLIGNGLCEMGEPWPFGERPHGGEGILEFYKEQLETDDPAKVFNFIRALAKGSMRGHWLCPCGSGKILRKCHHSTWVSLRSLPKAVLESSATHILAQYRKTEAPA